MFDSQSKVNEKKNESNIPRKGQFFGASGKVERHWPEDQQYKE